MRFLLPILLILSGCALRAQQSFPGINITPNGGAAGIVQFRTSANVNSMFVQNNTVDAAALGAANNSIIFKGSATAGQATFRFEAPSGNFALFCDTSGGTGGAWELTRTKIIAWASGCASTSNFDVHTDGTIRTSLGIGFYENGSLGGDAIGLRAPSGAVTSSYTINLPGTGPSVAGQALVWVSGSTYSWSLPSSGANTTLSNLTSPTAINQDLIPGASVTYNLGNNALGRWNNGYFADFDIGDDLVQHDGGFVDRTITITAPAAFTSSWTWQWPTGPGTSGYVLSTNGSGATSWVSAGSGTVSSFTIQGTANEVDVSGTCTITTTGTCTIGIPTNPTLSGTTTVGTLTSSTGNITTSGGYISGTEVRVSGNVVINSSGVLSNAFGVDVNAGVAGIGFNIHGGASGVTSTTCSQWTGGICTAP